MRTNSTFIRIDRIARATAISIGILAGLIIPGLALQESYNDHLMIVRFQANMAADIMAEHIYVQGKLWRFTENQIKWRIAPIIDSNEHLHLTVRDTDENPVIEIGLKRSGPTIVSRVPIFVREELAGFVDIDFDLTPFLRMIGELILLGLFLGSGTYLLVHHVPLRALRHALTELDSTHDQLRAQVQRTDEALEMARREGENVALANRTKSEFLANMSHELRTPLNAVIGFSDIMRNQIFGPLDKRYVDYAVDINSSGLHLLQIINDVLDISKVESGHLSVENAEVDLVVLLEACDRLVRARALESRVKLTLSPASKGDYVVYADPLRVKQIILNVLSNALKFTPEGGTVQIDLHADREGTIAVEVTDTGIGMTQEEIEIAFQPFRQIDNTHTRKHQGTGLGLPLARRLAELQNGTLELFSAPGQGTTVKVRLPAAPRLKQLMA